MASAFRVFVFAACFTFFHVSGGRELVVANEEKNTSSFKVRVEAGDYTFQDADTSISRRRIRSRFILEDTNEGKDLADDRKRKEMSEISESSGSELPERSSVGTNDNDRSPPTSVLWNVKKKKPSRSKKLPEFDSDYCLPRTHPPSHN